MNKRNTGGNLNSWNNTSKITKWTPGVVVWTRNRYVQIINNNQSNQDAKNQDNKNLIQYDFPFVSGVSKLSCDEKLNIQESLKTNAIKARIYFIRHGMSVEEEQGKELQSDSAELSEWAKTQYREIAQEFQKLWINNSNTYLLSCSETEDGEIVRIRDSAKILKEELWLTRELNSIKWLDTTDKADKVTSRRVTITKAFTIDFAHQLSMALQSNDLQNINIICLIHKSNIDGIKDGFFEGDKKSYLPSPLQISTGWIVSIDIDSSWKPINYANWNNMMLRFTEANHEELMANLWDHYLMKNIFERLKLWRIPLWEVQNYVNSYFGKDLDYHSYLEFPQLRIFCLKNLIRIKRFNAIRDFYFSSECKLITEEEMEILLEYSHIKEVRTIIRKIYILRWEFWLYEKDNSLIEKSLWNDEYERLKSDYKIFLKAVSIQSRSIDIDIREWKIDAIIHQNFVQKNGNNNAIQSNFSNIIESNDSYILPAVVWFWKTLWATQLVKEIITNYTDKDVVFFEWWEWSNQSMDQISEEIKSQIAGKKNVILIIDAFDEIGTDIVMKKKIIEILKELQKNIKIIITGRQSEFHETNNTPFKTLELEFNRNRFINEKGGRKIMQIKKIFITESLENEAINNPLLVFFICELANNSKSYGNLWVLSLEEILKISEENHISLKSLIYENVIKLIIAKHEQTKPKSLRKFWDDIKKNTARFKSLFDSLSQLAMGIAYGKSFDKMLKEYSWTSPEKWDFFDTVNILLKKWDEGDYQFAHKSFQEYFIFKHKESCENENTSWRNTWKSILNDKNEYALQEVLISIGLMNFESFEKDIHYLITQWENTIPLIPILNSIKYVKNPKELNLLRDITKLEEFRFDVGSIIIYCWIIWQRWNIDDLHLLEELMSIESFKKSSEAINALCQAIWRIWDPRWLYLLEEIVHLEAFKKSPDAINTYCFIIGSIQSTKGLVYLKEIVNLEVFKNSSRILETFCWVIGKIWDPRGLNLLEGIVNLEAFKRSPKAITRFFSTIKGIWSEESRIMLLDKIEYSIRWAPQLFYMMALTYNSYNKDEKCMIYLENDLEYQLKKSSKLLRSKIEEIKKEISWTLVETVGFRALIWKYEKILEWM
jgi:hypothetical protein